LVEIFNDEFLSAHLAFRGGTALHKLYLQPQPRYSEDIDLVQIRPEPIKETIIRLSEVLSFLGKPVVKQKANNNTLVFRFESEIPPVLSIRLKVETNCREHFNILGLVKQSFKVDSQWYSGACEITTYKLEELLGTKLRALYQRRKGRDLFDLYKAIKARSLNTEDIIKCYREYMNFVVTNPPSQKEFLLNMEAKVLDSEFLGDTRGLLRSNEVYEPLDAYELIKSELLLKI
jgi:predicted nucleotidyltransferase component of viral defense system